MASGNSRPQSPLYPSRRAPPNSQSVFAQSFYGIQDEQERVLRMLLEAFPGVSHEILAIAYARADRDPNKAAEIIYAETGPKPKMSAKVHAESSEFDGNWAGLDPTKGLRFLDEEEDYSSVAEKFSNEINAGDVSSNVAETHKLKNDHGNFAGASAWLDAPMFPNKARPPETNGESRKASIPLMKKPKSPDEGGNRAGSFSALRGNDLGRSRKNWSASPPKISAAAGSVSNRMQRRASGPPPTGNGSEVPIHKGGELDGGLYSEKMVIIKKGGNGGELDDGLYSEKMVKKKKKAEDGKGDAEERRRASEDFLHSMLGGEFGLDLVRDVLAYCEGDTGKALETLLNITASTIDCGGADAAVDGVKPLFASLEINDKIEQPPGAVLHDIASLETGQATDGKAVAVVEGEEERAHNILLSVLGHDFPAVEQSFLANVLEAAAFSYEGAVEMLHESGLRPLSEQNSKPKLDPNEVLQSLFRTQHEPPAVAGPFNEPLIDTEELLADADEPWSTVLAKPRSIRNPDVPIQQVWSPASNPEMEMEYQRQRTSANEHWESMKTYMTEANIAYTAGDRARAGVLSEKGAKFKEMAQAASNRASQNIFNVRNQHLPNNITIDLHSQHVAEALSLLQLHLRALSRIPSVNGLIVITGQGSHSAGGQAKLKPAVTRYLGKKHIPWEQDNPGCIVIKMSDVRRSDGNGSESYSDAE